MLSHLKRLSIVMLAGICAAPLPVLADAKSDYEMLFGKEAKQVSATKSTADDAVFAKKLLDAAKARTDAPKTQLFLYEKVVEFGRRDATGAPHALEAIELLIRSQPSQKAKWQEAKLNIAEKQFQNSRGAVSSPKSPSTAPSPKSPTSKFLTLDLGKGAKMKLARIPAGSFMMGSPKTEKGRKSHEGPQHKVTISPGAPGFYMGTTEVTQEQYEAVMGKNPSLFKAPKNPVEQVSWNDAVEFCKKVSASTRRTVRLPTEAEWEYACRAGSKTQFCFGDDAKQFGDYAWYHANSRLKTHPVAQKKPNAWGLYDMHGNVREHCLDWWEKGYYAKAHATDPQGPASGRYRVVRGGAYGYPESGCRSATRDADAPDYRINNVGFRVVVWPH